MWWQWLIFIIIIIVTPFAVAYVGVCVKRKNKLTKEQEKAIEVNVIKFVLFYWLADLFYMSFIIDSISCKYIFGGFILLIVFYNLTMSFLSSTKKDALQRVGLLQDFVVGMGLTIYLIYIIPGKQVEINGVVTVDNSLRDIITTIVAALYGGLLALTGVAWTIRKGDKDRKEDLMRIEKERKEEDRRKYSPVFSVVNKNIDVKKCVVIALDDIENIDKIVIQSDDTDNIRLQPICIENSSKVEFYVYGFLFDDEFYAAPEKFLIKKDYYFVVHFLKALRFARNYEISLCIEDLIENKYSVKLSSIIKDNAMYVKGNGQLQLMEKNNE